MEVFINNELMDLATGITVNHVVIDTLQLNPAGMAIAINDKIVPKSKWETTVLQARDQMLVIKASKGG